VLKKQQAELTPEQKKEAKALDKQIQAVKKDFKA
jgi:hypothetical protein